MRGNLQEEQLSESANNLHKQNRESKCKQQTTWRERVQINQVPGDKVSGKHDRNMFRDYIPTDTAEMLPLGLY